MAQEHVTHNPAAVKSLGVKRRKGGFDVERFYPSWTHPDVIYWAPTWALIRDCILGEQQIKAKESEYLPPLEEQSPGEYAAYLDRAVFFNMSGRTVSALTGVVFQKMPKITGLPDKEQAAFRSPTRTNITLESFLKEVTSEVITTGRVGVLMDMDTVGRQAPYFTHYTAENILDWSEAEIDGRQTAIEIVLREVGEAPRSFGQERKQQIIYRVLRLEPDLEFGYVYRQHVYKTTSLGEDLSTLTPEIVVPTRRGVPFKRIPFRFVGAVANTPSVDRSPMADIAALNIAHYKAYAQLEHGRFYTAMPVYFAMTPNGAKADYRIGSGVVWEVGLGEKPGIIEFNGQGLKFLESSCAQKEDQISALGGRLLSGKTRSVAESDNEVRLKEGNERAILLNVVKGVNDAMTELFRLWLWWRDHGEEVQNAAEIELNTQFLMDTLSARELRAIYAMYKDAVVPVTVLHYYLQMAEAIPDWMDVDEFKRLLESEEEFPNQPDVIAKMRGFASATEMHTHEREERLVVVEETRVGIEGDSVENDKTKVQADIKTQRQSLELQKRAQDITKNRPAAPARPAGGGK